MGQGEGHVLKWGCAVGRELVDVMVVVFFFIYLW